MDFNYEVKVAALRSYLPFLMEMMSRLEKTTNVSSREMQLQRMRGLCNVLKSDNKLKPDALDKCEDVLRKMTAKVRSDSSYKKFLPENDYLAPEDGPEVVEEHISRSKPPLSSTAQHRSNHPPVVKHTVSLTAQPRNMGIQSASVNHKGDVDYRVFQRQPHSATAPPPAAPLQKTSSQESLRKSGTSTLPDIATKLPSRSTSVLGSPPFHSPTAIKTSQPVKPQPSRPAGDGLLSRSCSVDHSSAKSNSGKPTERPVPQKQTVNVSERMKERTLSNEKKSASLEEFDMFTPKSKKVEEDRRDRSRGEFKDRRLHEQSQKRPEHDRKSSGSRSESEKRRDGGSGRHYENGPRKQERTTQEIVEREKKKVEEKSGKDRNIDSENRKTVLPSSRAVKSASTKSDDTRGDNDVVVISDSDSAVGSPSRRKSDSTSSLASSVSKSNQSSVCDKSPSMLSPPHMPHIPVQTFRYCTKDEDSRSSIDSSPGRKPVESVRQYEFDSSSSSAPYWKPEQYLAKPSFRASNADDKNTEETRVVKLLDKADRRSDSYSASSNSGRGSPGLGRARPYRPTDSPSKHCELDSPSEERQIFFKDRDLVEENVAKPSSNDSHTALRNQRIISSEGVRPFAHAPFPSTAVHRPLQPTVSPLRTVGSDTLAHSEDVRLSSAPSVPFGVVSRPSQQVQSPLLTVGSEPSSLGREGKSIQPLLATNIHRPNVASYVGTPVQPPYSNNRDPRNIRVIPQEPVKEPVSHLPFMPGSAFPVNPRFPSPSPPTSTVRLPFVARNQGRPFLAHSWNQQPQHQQFYQPRGSVHRPARSCPPTNKNVPQTYAEWRKMKEQEEKRKEETERLRKEAEAQLEKQREEIEKRNKEAELRFEALRADVSAKDSPVVRASSPKVTERNREDPYTGEFLEVGDKPIEAVDEAFETEIPQLIAGTSRTWSSPVPTSLLDPAILAPTPCSKTTAEKQSVKPTVCGKSVSHQDHVCREGGGALRTGKCQNAFVSPSSSDLLPTLSSDMNIENHLEIETVGQKLISSQESTSCQFSDVSSGENDLSIVESTSLDSPVPVSEERSSTFPSDVQKTDRRSQGNTQRRRIRRGKRGKQRRKLQACNKHSVEDEGLPGQAETQVGSASDESAPSEQKTQEHPTSILLEREKPDQNNSAHSIESDTSGRELTRASEGTLFKEPQLTATPEQSQPVLSIEEQLDSMINSTTTTIMEVEEYIKRVLVTSGALKLFELMPKLEALKQRVISGEQLVVSPKEESAPIRESEISQRGITEVGKDQTELEAKSDGVVAKESFPSSPETEGIKDGIQPVSDAVNSKDSQPQEVHLSESEERNEEETTVGSSLESDKQIPAYKENEVSDCQAHVCEKPQEDGTSLAVEKIETESSLERKKETGVNQEHGVADSQEHMGDDTEVEGGPSSSPRLLSPSVGGEASESTELLSSPHGKFSDLTEKLIREVVKVNKKPRKKKKEKKALVAESKSTFVADTGEASDEYSFREEEGSQGDEIVGKRSKVKPEKSGRSSVSEQDERGAGTVEDDKRAGGSKKKVKHKRGFKWSHGIVSKSPKARSPSKSPAGPLSVDQTPKKNKARKSVIDKLEEDLVDFKKHFVNMDRSERRFRTMRCVTLNEDDLLGRTRQAAQAAAKSGEVRNAETRGKVVASVSEASAKPSEVQNVEAKAKGFVTGQDRQSLKVTIKKLKSVTGKNRKVTRGNASETFETNEKSPEKSFTVQEKSPEKPPDVEKPVITHKVAKLKVKDKKKKHMLKLQKKRQQIVEMLRKDRARAKEIEDQKRKEAEELALSKVQDHHVSSATQEEPTFTAASESEFDRASVSTPSSLATVEEKEIQHENEEKKDKKKQKKTFFQPTRLSLRGKKSMYGDEDALEIATSDEPEIPCSADQYFQCKKCDYVGKKIIFHYVNVHKGEDIPYITLSDEQAKSVQREIGPPKEYLDRRNVSYSLSWIPDTAKLTQCLYCSFKSAKRNELVQHVFTHRSPKGAIFYCIACNYSCQDICDLYDHVAFHTGEYRYECGYCPNYSVSHHHLLKTHMATLHEAQDQVFYRVYDPLFVDDWLYGFICVSCKFYQIKEKNLHRHLASNPRCVLYRKVSLMRVSLDGVMLHRIEPRAADSPVWPGLEMHSRPQTPAKTPIDASGPKLKIVSSRENTPVPVEKASKPVVTEPTASAESSLPSVERSPASPPPPELEEQLPRTTDGTDNFHGENEDSLEISPPSLLPATSPPPTSEQPDATPAVGHPGMRLGPKRIRKRNKRLLSYDGKSSDDENSVSSETEKKRRKRPSSEFHIEIENAEIDQPPEDSSPIYKRTGYASSDEDESALELDQSINDIGSNPILASLAERIGIRKQQQQEQQQHPRIKTEVLDSFTSSVPKLDSQKNGQYVCQVNLEFLGDKCAFKTRSKLIFLFHIVKNHGSLICAENECWFTCDDNGKMEEHYDDLHPYGSKQMCGFCFQLCEDLYVHSLEVHNKEIAHVKCKINDLTGVIEAIDEPVVQKVVVKQEQANSTPKSATLRVRTDILAPRAPSVNENEPVSGQTFGCSLDPASGISDKSSEGGSSAQTPMITSVVSLIDGAVPFRPYMDVACQPSLNAMNEGPFKAKELKNPEKYKEMCKVNPIVKFFKCMDPDCAVTVNDRDIFTRHLCGHQNPRKNERDYLRCCYCFAMATSIPGLLNHMVLDHGHLRIQCLHCFYRALTPKHAAVHSAVVHGLDHGKSTALECGKSPVPPGFSPRKPAKILNSIQAYPCVVAGEEKATPACHKVRDPVVWVSHLVGAKHIASGGNSVTCPFCRVHVSHVGELCLHFACHKYAFFHCVWCKYPSNSLTRIINHLALFHPGSPDLCYSRLLITKDKTTIDVSTCEKFYEFSPLSLYPLAENWDSYFLTTFKTWAELSALLAELQLKKTIVFYHASLPLAVQAAATSRTDAVDKATPALLRKRGRPPKPLVETENNVEVSRFKLKLQMCKSAVSKVSYFVEPPRLKEIPPVRIERLWRKLTPAEPVELSDDETPQEVAPPVQAIQSDMKSLLERYPNDGKSGKELFLCGNPLCTHGSETAVEWRDHLFVCDFARDTLTIQCGHCMKKFKQMNSLEEHIHLHGSKRFVCGFCGYRYPTETQVTKHLRIFHKVSVVKKVEVDPTESNEDLKEFIFYPRSETSDDRAPVFFRRDEEVYDLEYPDKIPRRSVFIKTAKCGRCDFRTKIRKNLMRHFASHGKGQRASTQCPVNPMPCLETEVRHFDKMINLASSSNENEKKAELTPEEVQHMPRFIPETKRFVCTAKGCRYLTLDETMLKFHLKSLHGDQLYSCDHCKMTDQPLDKFIIHLKFHGPRLYKCPQCSYFHCQKTPMGRHISEKHGNKGSRDPIIIREFDEDYEGEDTYGLKQAESEEEVPKNLPWRCSLCQYSYNTEVEVRAHAKNEHNIKLQFQCGICVPRSAAGTMAEMEKHFSQKHPGTEPSILASFYYLYGVDAPAGKAMEARVAIQEAKPLWRRGVERVRHIRGILLDQEVDIPEVEDENDDIEVVLEERHEVHGSYGMPTQNNYSCPKCPKYKTSQTREFREHLLRELGCKRFQCDHCDYKATTRKLCLSHSASKHDGMPEAISQIPLDRDVDEYINGVINHQARLMNRRTRKRKAPQDDEPPRTPIKEAKVIDISVSPSVSVTTSPTKQVNATPVSGKIIPALETFFCDECDGRFQSRFSFLMHMKLNHLKLGKLICGLCTQTFNHEQSVTPHFTSVHPGETQSFKENPEYRDITLGEIATLVEAYKANPLKCEKCDSTFYSPEALEKHAKSHLEFECNSCKQMYSTESELKFHRKEDHSVCTLCKKDFSNRSSFALHVIQGHPSVEDVESVRAELDESELTQCLYCTEKVEDVVAHFNENHRDIADFVDTPEDAGTPGPSGDSIDCVCEHCGAVFQSIEDLLSHLNTKHATESASPAVPTRKSGVYVCEHCGFFSRSLSGQNSHYIAEHSRTGKDYSVTRMEDTEPEVEIKVQPKLKCEFCNSLFATVAGVQAHFRTRHPLVDVQYSKLLSFFCPMSGCGFMTSGGSVPYKSLLNHLKVHFKPFTCELCPFHTLSKSSMRTHMTYHPSESADSFKYHVEEDCLYKALSEKVKKVALDLARIDKVPDVAEVPQTETLEVIEVLEDEIQLISRSNVDAVIERVSRGVVSDDDDVVELSD